MDVLRLSGDMAEFDCEIGEVEVDVALFGFLLEDGVFFDSVVER